MYTAVQSSRRWNTAAPLICLLLLGLLLLAAAATVVISLITVYLPTRNIGSVAIRRSAPQQATLQLSSNSNVPTGFELDDTQQTSLQTQMQNAVSANTAIKPGTSVQVISAVGGHSRKRKRRATDEQADILFVEYLVVYSKLCAFLRCETKELQEIAEILAALSVFIEGTSGSGASSASSTSTLSSPSSSSSESSALGASSVLGSSSAPSPASSTTPSPDDEVTDDIDLIMPYWGNLRPYEENSPDVFGVLDTGLPAGCQVEQAHVLHRHAARYPAGSENGQILIFAGKATAGNGGFTGPLSFLNTWSNQLGTDVLVAEGATMEYASGIDFWDKYGRILYNAQPGQPFYNATGQTIPLLRCNNIPRVNDSVHAWADGFFDLYNQTTKYSLLVIPAATGVNNTLASFLACSSFFNTSYGIFDMVNALYYPIGYYLTAATTRLNQYAPSGVNLTVFDAFVMQQLCVYEYVALGSSDYCALFTLNEWRGFDYTLDLFVYNGFSFGSPQGRTIGIGILEELIARLTNQMITTSDSSVNSTLDSSSTTFPLGQKFYLDMSHDFVIVGLLTAMSLDYFRQDLEISDFPPPADRHFKTKYIVPYAARLITEKIGCVSSNPTSTNTTNTQYTSTQYGYSAANATNKFIRMRLNNGILPLDTIRGGFCAGRTDGLCPLSSFIASQANASAEANYGELCFGNYVYNSSGFSGDGNYFPQSPASPDDEVTDDIDLIMPYWGNLRPYEENSPDVFGVLDTGLPAGCQVEQAHVLHRHAARYPAGSENGKILIFVGKATAGNGGFTGPLSFLNTWSNQLGTDVLVAEGATMEYASGIDFWDKYGRILYNAQPGQPFYNATGQTIPLLRCNNIPRVNDSVHAWADGFFDLYNQTTKYSLLVIPAATGVNNTLASFLACSSFFNTSYGIFDMVNALYYPIGYYLTAATTRLNQYAPSGVNLTVFDAFVMQQLCVYEYVALGSSDYCALFTLNEWRGFDYTLDLFVYNGFSFGSPQGRTIGIGILEELIARLTNQMITTSDSSVNSTLDSSSTTFPLGQKFYLDMSHDFVIVGLLTAMSLDYFRQDLEISDFPPPADRHFKTKYIVPYAARLITEKIGCVSSNPTSTNTTNTQYTSTQYGYSAANATNKFIRMRLNNGILPLDTIRGGFCAGRTDGLCPLSSFIASQANASAEANYGELCFGNYVYNSSGFSGDGNYFPA